MRSHKFVPANFQFSTCSFQLITQPILLLSACILTACHSQHYALQSVVPHRIEVTHQLDAVPSASAEAFVAPFRSGVDSLRAPLVGYSETFMYGGRPESLLSNWVADALVATAQRMGYTVDLGICNVGGLRAAMPAGEVRRGDILAISPFENFLTILRLRGSDVAALMADIAAVHGEGVSASARIVITRDGRLKSATLGGKPIEPDSIYTIATLDYLADGNDRLTSLRRSVERVVTDQPVRETLMQHLSLLEQQGLKATARIEGRITEVAEGEAPVVVRQTEVGIRSEEPIVIRTATPKHKQRTLFVAHTNDTHSCIEPLSPNLSDTAQADKGGYLRRAALVQQLRKEHPSMLLFDSGDFSQGSAYYSLYHGDVEVGLMNLMGYDAATIGNHEFDWGVDNMARIFRKASFPIVCCNYDFTGTACEDIVKPYVILRREGVKIGVLGVSPKLEGLVAAATCEGVTYNDPIASAQAVATHLREVEHCDIVICLSHLGWQIPGLSDEEFITATHGIDVVLGGHSHTYFASPQTLTNTLGITVPDNQMGKNARYVGTLQLHLQK